MSALRTKESVIKQPADELIYFQVEWIDDFNYVFKNKKEVRSKIRSEVEKKGVSKKLVDFFEKTFYKIYLYMLKNEMKNVAVYLRGYVFVCKVDVLEKNLICIAILEENLEEHSTKIVDYVGGKIPEAIDYDKIYKVVWRYEFQTFAKSFLVLLILIGLSLVVYRYVWPVLFPKKKVVVTQQQQQPQQVDFSPEEQREAYALVFLQCLDSLKKKMVDLSQKDHVKIKEVRMSGKESSQLVECSVVVAEQYDYPAPETVKSGDYYEREEFLSASTNREGFLSREFLNGENASEFFVKRVGDFRKCLEVIARLDGKVLSRKGGVIEVEVKKSLTSRQAFLLPDLLRETVKVCGWDVLKVKEFFLKVGEEGIEHSARLEVKEQQQ